MNSRVTRVFMSTKLINKKGFFIKRKKNSYDFQFIDGINSTKNKVMKKIISFSTIIQRHHEKFVFDIVWMIIHDIVWNIFWLRKHNLNVDWVKRILKFERCNYVITIQFTHRQKRMINKKQNQELIAKSEFATLIKNDLTTKFDSTNININQQNQKIKNNEEIHAPFENLEMTNTMRKSSKHVLHIYKKWKHLFREKETITTLFKH